MQNDIYLRLAEKSDIQMLYELRNDDVVRKNSLNTEVIPYENHCLWFERKMVSDDNNIYICMCGDCPVGQIRVDYNIQKVEISYSIIKEYRGNGYGVRMIELLEKKEQSQIKGKILFGIVKMSNIASQKCFEKLGYKKEVKDDNVYYSKII